MHLLFWSFSPLFDIDIHFVEIIRDLRLGVFDVLVGVNLLREGLDMPEVSLVAVFDADKEGFLRSERSLIQTIGRAARNVDGMAIFYAARITNAMQVALDETARRREKQIAHNLLHGITPQTIVKSINDILDGVYKESAKNEFEIKLPENMSEKDLTKLIKQVEKRMKEHALNLEYEAAAKCRDELKLLRDLMFKN